MANEPSWEELFNPQPKASEPRTQQYPPTQAYPSPPAAAPVAPAPQPVDDDPFAQLFGGLETAQTPVVSQPTPEPLVAPPIYPIQQVAPPPAWSEPVTAPAATPDDPFAGLFGAPPAAAPVAPIAQTYSAAPEPALSADPFADYFSSQPGVAATPAPPIAAPSETVPLTRREMREREAMGLPVGAAAVASAPAVTAFIVNAAPASVAPVAATSPAESGGFPFDFGGGSSGGGGGGGGYGDGPGSGGRGGGAVPGKPKKRRNLLWLKITAPIVIVLGLLGGAAAFVWLNYEEQVREVMGWELPNDFEGTGNGEEVVVTIQSGDLGSDVANTLHDSGVTMTFDAFYELLLEQPENVNFIPGNYALQKQMSAQAALDALLDPANKVTSKLLITEGTTLPSALEIMAETTGIPLEEFQTAAADYQQFGVPAEAPSLEGYLFPATYELDGTETAVSLIQLLVDTMFERLDAAGVPVENRHRVLTMAALIQREAGPNTDDFYKISRVFTNRLEQGMNLQSDATVAYGTGNLQTVWTTDAERADASNLYNTYANPGMPIGPIGLPGELAIDAALHPADGPWLFFVPINLATGETVFSETADEHEANVEILREWCDASEENASYCE